MARKQGIGLTTKGTTFTAIGASTKGIILSLLTGGRIPPAWQNECDMSAGHKLASRGFLGAAVGIPTCGVVLRICESEPIPIIRNRKGGGVLVGNWDRPHLKIPRVKVVTVSCYAYGKIYTETMLVDEETTVTADKVKVVEAEGRFTIQVSDVKTY